MSLEESIKEMKEQLAKEEAQQAEPQEVEAEEEAKEDAPVEEKPEEKEEAKEAPKEEPKEDRVDNSAMARMRRETAAANKRAEEAEAKRAEAEAKLVDKEEIIPETPINPDIEELLEDNKFKKAAREFEAMEAKFKSSTPDYQGVASEYAIALAQSIRIQNPRMSNEELIDKTRKEILIKASNYMNRGFDPVEELYNEAKDLGFTGKSLQKEEKAEEKEEEIKPDMKKVAENRKKSAGTAASGGRSQGQLTQAAALDLTVAEWSKLPKEEKRRLMAG